MSTPEDKFRNLTSDEIIFCRMLFKDAIDYSRVKIFNGKWMPMQSESVVMTPNGNLYYPKNYFKKTFLLILLAEFLMKGYQHSCTKWSMFGNINMDMA